MATKVYTLDPRPFGGFSNRLEDYDGVEYQIAAVSIKQAYYFAGREVWASDTEDPAGILSIYRRGAGGPGDHWLWDGCREYGGKRFEHGTGKRAIAAAMRNHIDEDHD